MIIYVTIWERNPKYISMCTPMLVTHERTHGETKCCPPVDTSGFLKAVMFASRSSSA